MASWLDEDPQVAEFLRRYQLSQEQERALKMQKLSDFGFGMMGARKGQELQAVGRAGLLAGEGYRRNRESAQQENMQRLQMTQYVQRMAEQERARAAQDAFRARLGQIGSVPNLDAMQPGGPTQANAERIQSPNWNAYSKLYADEGQPENAKRYHDMAQSGRKQLDKQIPLVRNGKRVIVNVYKDGTYEILDDVEPDLEKPVRSDEGGHVTFRDAFTARPVGAPIQKSKTFSDMTAEGNLGVARGNLGLSQQRFAHDKAQAARGPAGQYDAALGMIVDTRAGTARPVVGPDGQPLARPDKPLSETQGKATALANQMQEATKVIAELAEKKFTGKTLPQQVASSLAGSKGVPYTLGTAAIPKMIAGADAQKYRQAELQWSEAMLRFLTGAAAPDSEVARNADTYFPRPGDTPEVVKQKEDMRAASERSVRLAAGKAGNAQLPAMPAAGGSTAPSIDDLVKKYAP
jgi:hypothetical protein